MLKEEELYVSKDKELRVEIIQLHHDVLAAGHRGRWKTKELVIRDYWWPEVIRDVGKYVNGCNLCQKIKNRIKILAEKLKLNKIPEKL